MKESDKLLDSDDESSSSQPSSRQSAIFRVVVIVGAVLLVVGSVVGVVIGLYEPNEKTSEDIARELMSEFPLVDGHNDLPWRYRVLTNDSVMGIDISVEQPQSILHTDIPRLRRGHVGSQFWSIYVGCEWQGKDAVRAALEQIDVVYKMIRRYPNTFEYATSTDDIKRIFIEKKIGCLMGLEGAHMIDASLGTLRNMYNLGVRYMTLTHTCNNEVAASSANGCASNVDCRQGTCVNSVCTAPQTTAITEWGRHVILEMNRLGMMVDISHVSFEAQRQAMNISLAPVIYSHSSAYALCSNSRNVPNDVLLRLKENGGIIMITFVRSFISCNDNATLKQVADHIDYVAKGKCPDWVANCNPNSTFPGIGVDFIGYGSDFDGAVPPIGLDDVSKFVDLTAELITRGYSEEDVQKIIGGNLLRVFERVEQVSKSLSSVFPAEQVIFPQRPCRVNQ